MAAAADSHLRSVFLQHRLIARWRQIPGVPLPAAKYVIEQIVERLLGIPGGMEPLLLLERDPRRLADDTEIAVLTVVLARAAGWPTRMLADLGAAALLAQIGAGSGGDGEGAARAGFRWLLARGADDFWLRCALVARHARTPAAELPPTTGGGGIAVVRLAVAIHGAMQRAARPADWAPELRLAGGDGSSQGLLAVAAAAFAEP